MISESHKKARTDLLSGAVSENISAHSKLLVEESLTFSHKFCLDKPYRLTQVSQMLCDTLGYTEDEIITNFNNLYSPMVHPDDRERFLKYLDQLASCEQSMTIQYRMIRKDGTVVNFADIMFSHKKQDGHMYGFAVVAEIKDPILGIHSAQPMMNLPANASPFGYLQCTCEKYPKVLCINEQMLTFLGASEESSDWKEFLHDNIFFMLPFEDRDLFRHYLEMSYEASEPVKISHSIIKQTGERVSVTGWLGTILNQNNEKNYSIIYTDLEKHPSEIGYGSNNSYFRALESAYNVIFEINLLRHTVECIYGKETSDLGKLYDVRMTLESAMEFWLNNYIVEEDRAKMRLYLKDILTPGKIIESNHPLQTEFRLTWDDNVTYSFIGVAIQLNASAILFCCRDTAKVQYSSMQAREIRAMRKLHSYMERSFESRNNAIASAIFEMDDENHCTLLYASQSVQHFMGLRPDQYLHYMEEGFLLDDVIRYAMDKGVAGADTLMSGADLQYVSPETAETITLQVQETIPNVYQFLALQTSTLSVSQIPHIGVFVRTFGYFDVFVNGQPVVFSNYKEKELLALLIDRNGGTLSSNDGITYLWEDAPLDNKTRARFRKLAMGLKQTLQRYGIEHIMINTKGVRSIDTKSITCDYYELLAGNTQYVQSFHNSYMSDYAWAEQTLATLWDYS